jgi:hypothetical protein
MSELEKTHRPERDLAQPEIGVNVAALAALPEADNSSAAGEARLWGGLGAARAAGGSDPHEDQAEAVGAAVASGRSARPLLANGGTAGAKVQRKAEVVTAAVAGAVALPQPVLIDDEVDAVPAGAMKKRDFLTKLEPALKAEARAELGFMWSVAACPYIARYIKIYSARPAANVEQFVRRYTGSKANEPETLMSDLVAKVRVGIREWRATGKLPADAAAADPGAAAAATAAAGGAPGIQRKADNGQHDHAKGTPEHVLGRLGEGAPLDPGIASKMADAFGTSFGDVRIHADAEGAELAREHNALAFTVGTHIAFAPGRYQPGTVEGDALLAHELTHVLQQRGSAPQAPQRKSAAVGEQHGDAAENDADQAALTAVQRIHGGGTKTASAGAKAEAKTSNDLQLQRCEGVAEAPTLPGFHRHVYTWDGDPFQIVLRTEANKLTKGSFILFADIQYSGKDDTDGHDPSMSFMCPIGKTFAPQVKTDQPDGWTKLDIDLYGDASWVASISHSTKLIDGWNPKSRQHHFFGKAGGEESGPGHDVIVKSKDAMPGTGANVVAQGVGSDVRALRSDVAATSTKTWLDELLDDPLYGLDAKAPPWAALKQKVDADAAKFTSPKDQNSDEALRLTRLGEVLEHCKPLLRALGVASKREAYLNDIADQAILLVGGVKDQFATAIAASWDGDASGQIAAAEKAFNTVWFRITSLYMEQGKGAHALIGQAQATANDVRMLRGADRGAIYYPHLEAMLRVPGASETGGSIVEKASADWLAVREEFLAGKPGTLQKVTKVVEDAQLSMGLAALLCTNEIFHSMKHEMAGLVGGAANTIGKDLNKVCDDYIGQFESMAAGVEAQLAKGVDINTAAAGVVAKFQGICSSDKFKKDTDAIKSRIKTVKVIETLGKVLAIIGVAALTGGAAGAAVGGALEGAGATAGVVATGEFAAEVVTFTVASRIGNQVAFGKNGSSFGEDLITNALMFGFLKAAAAGYGRVFKVFADPKVYKTTYAVGGAVTGMVALQSFAEVHYRLKEGKWMDGDERLRGVMSNAIILAAMSLGGFMTKPLNKRVHDDMLVFVSKHFPERLAQIEGKIGDLKGQVDALGKANASADQAAEVLKKVETLWNEELKVLAEAAEKEAKSNNPEATKKFQETVARYVAEIAKLELQLASSGLDVDLGPNKAHDMFKPVSPGFVAFKPEALEILRDFYKENHGTFEELKDKPGMWRGKANGEEMFFISGDKAEEFFDKPRPKAPTEKEAAANRAEAAKARTQNAQRGARLKDLLLQHTVDGHVMHKVGRIIEGTGLAAAMDANTLPGATHGEPKPLAAIPDTIGVGTGLETFSKLGETPIGQAAPELASEGWGKGASPADMTADHGNYASATTISDAIALTQYRTGVPILDAAILEVSIKPDATWKVTDAKVRVKVKLKGVGEVYIYGDATDIATGLGAPRELETNKINSDPTKAEQYRGELESTGRLVNGDTAGRQRGGKVLVSGGSATAAWNAKIARELGGSVDWIAEDRTPTKQPASEAGKRTAKELEDELNAGTITPDQFAKEMAKVRAFDAAALPRNVQAADAPFNDAGINRSVKGIASLTPMEHLGGDAGKVRVTFTDGTTADYDQVVVSHGTDMAKAADPGPAGALTLAKGIEMRPVIFNGKVVALESVNPPGAVRVLGAAMWSRAWLQFIPETLTIDGRSARDIYDDALTNQAINAPRDSPANPLIHNVGQQIPAANQALTKSGP